VYDLIRRGLKYIDSWVDDFARCFQLMEYDESAAIQQWVPDIMARLRRHDRDRAGGHKQRPQGSLAPYWTNMTSHIRPAGAAHGERDRRKYMGLDPLGAKALDWARFPSPEHDHFFWSLTAAVPRPYPIPDAARSTSRCGEGRLFRLLKERGHRVFAVMHHQRWRTGTRGGPGKLVVVAMRAIFRSRRGRLTWPLRSCPAGHR